MKRIIVSVTNDLVTDQRVHKVCTSLTKADYKITLIGRKFKESKPLEREYRTIRMHLIFNSGFLFYAEYNLRLFFLILFLKKDILLANDLDTLLPNFLVSKFMQKKLVYDSHELFTEVPELVDRPKTQYIWLALEKKILPNVKNCITVCDSISEYYKKKYSVPFEVIRNVPTTHIPENINYPFQNKDSKIILYQGAVNKGRGLELILETMPHLEDFLLVIIGTGDILFELQSYVQIQRLNKKVQFLGRISPEKLKNITPYATIGISMEEDLGLNYRYALPNKIFDYIQAEVPCLVSNLPEMKKVILENNFGEIIKNRNPKVLAKQIETFCENKPQYESWKHSLHNSKDKYNWKEESQKLIYLYKNLN